MKRQAILIETSNLKNHDDLPGAREDVKNYKAFLRSDFGGAWREDEVDIVRTPTKKLLKEWTDYAATCDYAFVTFSGHGHHVKGMGIDETRVCINDSEEVPVYELNPGCKWSLIVADTCRKVTIITIEKHAKTLESALEETRAALRPNRDRCRELFDSSMDEAEVGPIYMYSCAHGEAAADLPSFSRALVGAGEVWAEERKKGVLTTREAFATAAAGITRRNRQQHPQMEPGRRNVHFPFAVFA